MTAAALTDRPLLYSARPSLTIDGQARPDLSAALVSLAVAETEQGLFTLEATFGNWGTKQGSVGYLYFDRDVFDFGKTVRVEVGAGEAAATVFHGRISALEGRFPVQRPPELLVLAEDRLQDLRMTRRTRTFEAVTTSDVVRRVAGDHGLGAELDVDDVQYATLAQLNQTDLGFLRELGRAADADVWVEERALHMKTRARRRGGEVRLAYGQTLREFSVTADLSHQRTAVVMGGWDVAGKAAIAEEATDSAVRGELSGGLSGASLLRQAFGERTERVVHAMPLSSAEARARAQARFRAGARRFLVGHGVAEGDGRIRVGARVLVRELGELFNGPYYVCEAKHVFDARRGFRTLFTVERAGLGARA